MLVVVNADMQGWGGDMENRNSENGKAGYVRRIGTDGQRVYGQCGARYVL